MAELGWESPGQGRVELCEGHASGGRSQWGELLCPRLPQHERPLPRSPPVALLALPNLGLDLSGHGARSADLPGPAASHWVRFSR